MHIRTGSNGLVEIRGVTPRPGSRAEAFGWIAIPGSLIGELRWYDDQPPAGSHWLLSLGHLLSACEPPPTQAHQFKTWVVVVKGAANLLRDGATTEARQLLEFYNLMRVTDMLLEDRGDGSVRLVLRLNASQVVRSEAYQRNILARAIQDRQLLKKLAYIGENYP